MSDSSGWPDPSRPGVPLNPERIGAHWLRRKSGGLEAWAWDPDADGCGTEYSGAWQEADGDGQPDDMARWAIYEGPCLTPAEVAALVEQARREGAKAMRDECRAEMCRLRSLPLPGDTP